MTDNDDIFVKRVDFEVNNNKSEPINTIIGTTDSDNDVEKLAESNKKETCTSKFCEFLDKFGIKSALSHAGLLISLGLWCLLGGWVTIRFSIFIVNSKHSTSFDYLEILSGLYLAA